MIRLESTRISEHGGARRNRSSAWITIRCARRRAAAGDDAGSGLAQIAGMSAGPAVHRRRAAARRGLHRCAVRQRVRPDSSASGRRWPPVRLTSSMAFAGATSFSDSSRGTDRHARGRPRRLLRAVRDRSHPHDTRPEGKDRCRDRRWDGATHLFLASMAAYVGLDPRKDINWVDTLRQPSPSGSSPRARSMPLLGFPPDPRSCGRRRSGTWSSTARWIGRGRSISVA